MDICSGTWPVVPATARPPHGAPGEELARPSDRQGVHVVGARARYREARKKKAQRGWIADPPPPVAEPLPRHHITKWFTIMGARYLLRERESGDGDDDW